METLDEVEGAHAKRIAHEGRFMHRVLVPPMLPLRAVERACQMERIALSLARPRMTWSISCHEASRCWVLPRQARETPACA